MMTHYRLFRPARSLPPIRVPGGWKSAWAAIFIAAVLWLGIAHVRLPRTHSNSAVLTAKSACVVGTARADCYRRLRLLHLTAINIAYAAWKRNALGVWYRADDGAWPQPADARLSAARPARRADPHPDVQIRVLAYPIAGCGMTIIEQLLFDAGDRIAKVGASVPFWSCG